MMSDDKTEAAPQTPDARAENRYDFQTIERKWQKRWRKADLFRTHNGGDRPKFYALSYFPYPSGEGISVGHCRNYVPVDVSCRFKTMQGYNVLNPMGWDAFGQPAENEAIKRGRNPQEMVPEYAANYRRQLTLVGNSYDWSREIDSSLPNYYRWTQWFFLLLYKRGLAYRADTPINWCPSCKTGLANEEVVAGKCWRCGTPVEKRPMPQWYFKITEYADRLIAGLDTIQWPEGIKQQQREWVGRSEGAEVDFPIRWSDLTPNPRVPSGCETGRGPVPAVTPSPPHPLTPASAIRVFTTRPDTLWGATFMVLAPEHPLVEQITAPEQRAAVEEYRRRAQLSTDIERQNAERTKTGVFTGAYATNPVNGEPVPVWIADYVLMGYGTGAIMAVPAHDQRDFEFARKFDIPIVLVYKQSEEETPEAMTQATADTGAMAVGPFAGLPNNKETVRKVVVWLEAQGTGKGVVNYRLRDWLISRQRYWGAPIPIIHCEEHGAVPVPDDQLPVTLPSVEKYQPTGTGESPLAGIPEFVGTTCPVCGKPARRETDTMGGFACSSWYFLRFADPHNADAPFSPEAVKYWLPVDQYVGGAEHAVMHLLYARFWTKVMHDAGLIDFDEPFQHLRNQGMLLAYTPGRAVTKADTAAGEGEETDGDEPIENWKVLRPEDRKDVPEAEWIWRWVKMSKSMGNVITPDQMAERYGADSLRLYTLFVAPFEETVQWQDKGIEGAHRFANRVWRLWTELRPHYVENWGEGSGDGDRGPDSDHSAAAAARSEAGEPSPTSGPQPPTPGERQLRRKLHQTIRKVTEDIENFRGNTCVAALMELTNELSAFRNALGGSAPSPSQAILLSEILETLPLLLSPIAPHLADEFWERLGKDGFTFRQPWPIVDEQAAAEDAITIVLQVNGKLRDRLQAPVGTSDEEIQRLALENPKIQADLAGKQVRKVIVVPGRLVNVVVG